MYEAEDVNTNQRVAVKQARRQAHDASQGALALAFEAQVRLLAGLDLDGLLVSSLVFDGEGGNNLGGFVGGDLQLDVLSHKLLLHLTNTSSSFEELIKTTLDVLLVLINSSPVGGVQVLVQGNEGKITLGSNEHSSTHALEVEFTD